MHRKSFFIVGSQKSGTTWLRDCLDCFVPFCKPEWYYPELVENIKRSIETYGQSLPLATRENMLRDASRAAWMPIIGTYQGEKSAYPCLQSQMSPAHSSAVNILKDHFPDARIVVIVRDPRAVLNSFKHFLEHFHTGSSNGLDVEKFAEGWVRQNATWLGDTPHCVVRYEDLKLNYRETLKRVLFALEIEHSETTVLDAEAKVFDIDKLRPLQPEIYRTGLIDEWRVKLPATEVKSIESIAGEFMAGFNYEVAR